MCNDFMTIEVLATSMELMAAVSIIVQFNKSIVKKQFEGSVIRLYVFIILLILTFIFVRAGQGIHRKNSFNNT